MYFLVSKTILIAIIGWIISAIINYITDVLPNNRRLVKAHCASCGVDISLMRYLSLKDCEQCNKKLSLRHFIVQICFTLLYVIIAISDHNGFLSIVSNLTVIAFFTIIIIIDIEHHLILHTISLFGAILMIIIGWMNHGWIKTLLGGVAGLTVMFLLYLIGVYFSKALSKKRGEDIEEGLGFGDVILCFVCGLLLGWPGITIGLFTGIMLGGIYSLGIVIYTAIKKQYQPFMAIPYGPFLAGATLFFWLFR